MVLKKKSKRGKVSIISVNSASEIGSLGTKYVICSKISKQKQIVKLLVFVLFFVHLRDFTVFYCKEGLLRSWVCLDGLITTY